MPSSHLSHGSRAAACTVLLAYLPARTRGGTRLEWLPQPRCTQRYCQNTAKATHSQQHACRCTASKTRASRCSCQLASHEHNMMLRSSPVRSSAPLRLQTWCSGTRNYSTPGKTLGTGRLRSKHAAEQLVLTLRTHWQLQGILASSKIRT